MYAIAKALPETEELFINIINILVIKLGVRIETWRWEKRNYFLIQIGILKKLKKQTEDKQGCLSVSLALCLALTPYVSLSLAAFTSPSN